MRTSAGARVSLFWGAIGVGWRHFHILNKRKEAREEELNTLNGAGYRRSILPPVMHKLQEKGVVFMQDGARVHTANATLAYLDRKQVKVLQNWPPRSPDLNPIEKPMELYRPRGVSTVSNNSRGARSSFPFRDGQHRPGHD